MPTREKKPAKAARRRRTPRKARSPRKPRPKAPKARRRKKRQERKERQGREGRENNKVAKKGDADADKDEDADTSDDASGGKDGKDADTTSTDADDASSWTRSPNSPGIARHRDRQRGDEGLAGHGAEPLRRPARRGTGPYVVEKPPTPSRPSRSMRCSPRPITGDAINDAIAAATRTDARRLSSPSIRRKELTNAILLSNPSTSMPAPLAAIRRPGRQPHESEFRRISGPEGFNHGRHLRAGQTDLSSRLALAAAMPHEIRSKRRRRTTTPACWCTLERSLTWATIRTFLDRYGDAISTACWFSRSSDRRSPGWGALRPATAAPEDCACRNLRSISAQGAGRAVPSRRSIK